MLPAALHFKYMYVCVFIYVSISDVVYSVFATQINNYLSSSDGEIGILEIVSLCKTCPF